jgi:RimJ/RimL family protein N-acetyltransferase
MSGNESNVRLRGVIQSDLPVFFEQQLDPEATAMAAFPSREGEAFMAHWARIMADKANLQMTIEYEGRVAGNMVSFALGSERDIGYWLGKEYWGKGIATRALREFLNIEQTRPLYGHVARHNLGSRRVLEKCGFQLAGEDKYVNPAGKEVEEFIFRLE